MAEAASLRSRSKRTVAALVVFVVFAVVLFAAHVHASIDNGTAGDVPLLQRHVLLLNWPREQQQHPLQREAVHQQALQPETLHQDSLHQGPLQPDAPQQDPLPQHVLQEPLLQPSTAKRDDNVDAESYTPLVTPPPDQDAVLTSLGYKHITYYTCNTVAGSEHCGWHVPVVKAQGIRRDSGTVWIVVVCVAGVFVMGLM